MIHLNKDQKCKSLPGSPLGLKCSRHFRERPGKVLRKSWEGSQKVQKKCSESTESVVRKSYYVNFMVPPQQFSLFFFYSTTSTFFEIDINIGSFWINSQNLNWSKPRLHGYPEKHWNLTNIQQQKWQYKATHPGQFDMTNLCNFVSVSCTVLLITFWYYAPTGDCAVSSKFYGKIDGKIYVTFYQLSFSSVSV